MTSNIFQDIKDRVDLKDLVRYYGLELNRGGFACCPFHNERNPSFKVYEDHYHCFGCGAHGDHIDFVQKLYGVSNIEAAKRISHDFGLRLFDTELATPVDPYLKQKNDMNRWLKNARETILAYLDILEHWEKVYAPRSPIDPVSERFLESVHQKGYASAILDELTYGSDKEKKELYKNAQDYVRRIKNRLDIIDMQSRDPKRRAI